MAGFATIVHLAASIAIIFGLAYVVGQAVLSKGAIGNDGPLHLAYASWIDEYFPAVPHWYPGQGGGVSILHGYPVLSHYIVVLTSRALALSLPASFQLVVFFSYPLTAVGIYLFGWVALRRQTVGLMAAVFYLLAPITWTWVFEWGFLAQCVAMVFLPLGLVAYHLFHSSRTNRAPRWKWALLFVGTVVFLGLAFLTHPTVGAGLLAGILLYGPATSLVGPKEGRLNRVRDTAYDILLLGTVVVFLLSFYFVPFYRYGLVANREGLNTIPLHAMNRLPIEQFLGLKEIDGRYVLTHMANSPVLMLFAFLCIPLAGRLSRKGLILALIALFAAVYSHVPEIPFALQNVSGSLGLLFGMRSMLVVGMILIPICGAFGAWLLASGLLSPKSFIQGSQELDCVRKPWSVKDVLTSLVAVILVGTGMFFLPRSWPDFTYVGRPPVDTEQESIASALPAARPLRLDISPYQGRMAMDFATSIGASQINVYTYTLSLIHGMWGYQQNVFYSKESGVNEYGNATTLNNLGKWMGINYVVLNPELDQLTTYQEAGWTPVLDDVLWRSGYASGLANLSSGPSVLVIGKTEVDSYMTVFRLANEGMLPYEDAFLIEGNSRIDSYTIQDLQSFDALILYGYDYKKSTQAWDLLAEYVSGGGSLFIDTGWQYRIPEWEFESAPDVLPLTRLTWTNYGKTGDYRIEASEVAGEVDLSSFDPLVWGSDPWSVSGAERDEVRDWGRVVLSAAGQPLVVSGQFGQGRVVWSGMNLIAHAWDNRNQEEIGLLHNLIAWLIEGKMSGDMPVVVTRDHPDRVLFELSQPDPGRAWLYWREAYYPSWNAYLVSENDGRRELPIYRAGPGFMSMPLEGLSGETKVELVWETPLIEELASGVSLLAAIALAAFTLDALFLGGSNFDRLVARVQEFRKREKRAGKVEWMPVSGQGLQVLSGDDPEYGVRSSGLRPNVQMKLEQSLHVPDELREGHGGEEIEVLLSQLDDSTAKSTNNDREAEAMIEWWRRSRKRADGE